jgi:hypothetical protein
VRVMGGQMIYEAPERHWCQTWTARAPVGSVWRCGACGAYWKLHGGGLLSAGAWHPMQRFELWRWKRRHPEHRGQAGASA